MTDEQMARVCCALLGWTWDKEGHVPGEVTVWRRISLAAERDRDDGVYRAGIDIQGHTVDVDSPAHEYVVDLPTLAIAALVRHAGPVDVGPCPECEGDGVQHWGVTNPDRDPNEFRREGWLTRGGPQWAKHRACPSCPPRAKNTKAARKRAVHAGTGRRIVSAPEAVLLAAPRDARFDERGTGWRTAHNGVIMVPTVPGHEGAREALRALAEGWREHLPVIGDYYETIGGLTHSRGLFEGWRKDNPEGSLGEFVERHVSVRPGDAAYWPAKAPDCPGPRSLAECPAIARWLLAGLGAAEFREELGARSVMVDAGTHEHIDAIYAHLTAAWERETVECGCGGRLRTTTVPGGAFVGPCQRCAGLGRVTPGHGAAA